MNTVTGPYIANVDGKPTGFSGCDSLDCPKDCLRKDARLLVRSTPKDYRECRYFVPIGERE